MKNAIVFSKDPITLVGGGEIDHADLHAALAFGPLCVAADGGAGPAHDAGVDIAAVIGDLDSLTGAVRAALPSERVYHIAEQDSTDFDKALRHIAAPVVLAVGFSGARLDHTLAALNVLVRRPGQPCLILGGGSVTFLCPPRIEMPLAAGEVVSLFPMGPVEGRSEGLRWPIDGLTLDPMARVGTSNAADGPVRLQVAAPRLLVMVPARLLGWLTNWFAGAPELWPEDSASG